MQENPNPRRGREISLLVFSIVGIVGLLGRAVYLVVVGLNSFDPAQIDDLAASILDALSMLFCASLLFPMMIYSIRRLKGREIPPARIPAAKGWQVAALAGVWLLSVIAAAGFSAWFAYGWIIAVPFFLVGIVLPIAAWAWIAAGGQPAGSRRRLWAILGLSMAGSTVLAVLAEYAVIGLAALAFGILAIAHPEWMTIARQLQEQVTGAGDMQSMLTILAPYLTNPLVILAVLAFASGIGPLIEEAAKPAAIWLLGRQLRSPAEGFALGALCGAGFALLEGLMAASGATTMLGFGLAARAASSLMHITASGLVGWGIASARLERRPGRFVIAYLLAVSLHGLWNGSVVVAVFGALRLTLRLQAFTPDLLGSLAVLAGMGMLALLLAALLVALPLLSARLRPRQAIPAAAPANDIIAPPTP
jgi:RsiW-degrading membrane proteinase PrsW (M82 family)